MSKPRSLGGPAVALVAAAGLVVTALGVHAAAWIVAPTALAGVLVLVVDPLRRTLIARGWPGWTGALAVYLTLAALLAAFGLTVAVSMVELAELAPQYAEEASELGQRAAAAFERLGLGSTEAAALGARIDPVAVVRSLASALGSAVSVAGGLVLLVSLLLFMTVDAARVGPRLAAIGETRPELADALRAFASGTRRYLLVATVFGLAVAVLDGVALWLLGVPLPLLWALLAFVTNYIPNIGFVIGLAPPALLALLDGGVGTMLWVVAVYCAVNFVLQSIVQPKIVGDAVDLSVTASFAAVLVWTWLIGGLGAVLAIPLTLLVKALLVDAPKNRPWTAVLAANGSLPER
ncbi:AI-2E family transporter [Glycomyces endophyticus]|uniref:AI-2E family transporter n=1 Tax=Glycomyces endophyticus TaxID=480996 RepID=A0ABN2G6Y1_9ACTN